MLPVDRPQDAPALGHLEVTEIGLGVERRETERLVTRDDDCAWNRRQVVRLATLPVVLNQFVDLTTNDVPLIGLLVGREAPL